MQYTRYRVCPYCYRSKRKKLYQLSTVFTRSNVVCECVFMKSSYYPAWLLNMYWSVFVMQNKCNLRINPLRIVCWLTRSHVAHIHTYTGIRHEGAYRRTCTAAAAAYTPNNNIHFAFLAVVITLYLPTKPVCRCARCPYECVCVRAYTRITEREQDCIVYSYMPCASVCTDLRYMRE